MSAKTATWAEVIEALRAANYMIRKQSVARWLMSVVVGAFAAATFPLPRALLAVIVIGVTIEVVAVVEAARWMRKRGLDS